MKIMYVNYKIIRVLKPFFCLWGNLFGPDPTIFLITYIVHKNLYCKQFQHTNVLIESPHYEIFNKIMLVIKILVIPLRPI